MAALQPDVVVTQDLCAVCAVDLKAVQRCANGASIVSLNPFTIQDVMEDILRCCRAQCRAGCAAARSQGTLMYMLGLMQGQAARHKMRPE